MDILDQNIAEAKKVKQDKDVKSRDGTQPKKYFDKKGDDKLAKSTKQDRARHFEKGAKMSDDNPDAYKPAHLVLVCMHLDYHLTSLHPFQSVLLYLV